MAKKRAKSEEPKKTVKSEEPKKKKPISLNILEISKRIQKLEQTSGMPSEYPATQVMMSDGVTSVEEALIYSTTEHKVGKWIDGSDLYEKTIDFGAGANNTRKGLSSGLSNVTIRDLKAWGNSNVYGFGSVYIDNSDTDAFYYDYSNNYITQYANHNLSAVSYYVTLRYTKNS